MKINISGHHIEITNGIRNSIDKKMNKIATHYPDMKEINVIVKVQGHEQSIEINTQFLGAPFCVTVTDKDLYKAIQDSAKKLETNLEKRKGVLKGNRDSLKNSTLETEEIEVE